MGTPLFVKVCGLRTERDVEAAVEAGTDAIGFVFAESPRRVDAGTARRLAARVPDGVLTVGVFRDQPPAEVRALLDETGMRAVQLHGGEDLAYYDSLRPDGRTLIRGAAVKGEVPRFGERGEDILLLDAPVPGAGEAWDLTGKQLPAPGQRWLLAGGLAPHNVAAAVRTARPWGVDVSSGIETSRGVKSPELITAFIAAARGARTES
ncbi:phosphoribosylanthranilate isomerase [Streptomyces sp. PKU-MA01144]|uniref:phosphoribosylanthranilate isomerase n=1 Tax=Streptomyces sp. PKU-MA01144 TaxID=2729138 RepID=UPI001479FA73|nr:phosphoribosylanthranilate isomerase [Streptomyces sp. PKU-MA01144]NNJ03252.1 phosphoribosylanthranilate isomerase [Streptomyces sp. PKU-MA01144]